MSFFKNLASYRFRWISLIFIAMSLAIVIIDNNVLNVAIPYILKDLNASLDGIQWVISGYALIISTLLITAGRLGDMFGRKKIFRIGVIFFAIGSFIASISPNITILFLGEALIEAIGAAMMLTSSLSLLAGEFRGKERAIAFGIWGSVAGASAALGPLLGGYLTSYYSWRWSLRINVIVAVVAIIGSVFIMESREDKDKTFDWLGALFSGLGLFSLIFGFIEGQKFGWWVPNETFSVFGISWPFPNISVIPFFLFASIVFLVLFIWNERRVERLGKMPHLRLSSFKNKNFSIGLATLGILALGQFGTFFIMPIYLQNVLDLDAFHTGLVVVSTAISIMIFGPFAGFLSSKIGPKWVVTTGMFILTFGAFLVMETLSVDVSPWSFVAPLAILGIGIGLTSSQLTNTVISSLPHELAGEASAANATIRQIGTSIGVAIIGSVLAVSLTFNIQAKINNDKLIPQSLKPRLVSTMKNVSVERGVKQLKEFQNTQFKAIESSVTNDVRESIVNSSKDALKFAILFILSGALLSILIPKTKHRS